jgi:DNA-binding NarL/FixJ family response regulator
VKVLLIDDHALFRAGIRMLLGTLDPATQALEASTIADALALAAQHPDLQLCLLDLSLKAESGLGAVTRIKAAAPRIAVVVVSAAEDNATIRACLDAGAMSFIPKSVEPEVLTRALKFVLGGTPYLPECIVERQTNEPTPALTARQLDVLRCLSRALPTKLIAHELGLSEYTIKEHIGAIFAALGARNRTDAVIKASQLGLLLATPAVR